jgi:pyruvate kinase
MSSELLATIQSLVEAGANVFRLNFSHGTHEDHQRRLAIIREVERQSGRPIGETVVISAGMPFGVAGTTNLLRIAQIH